ncbi:MAG: FecR family protein, partial [Halieaceae bacterium]
MNRLFTALILVAAQFVATSASQASAVAGEVLFVAGPNSVEREGPTIGLLKGSFIFEGDTINTGAKGRIQLLMVDGARIAIRPNTTFSVQTYQLPGRTKDPIAIASNDGKAVLRLAKGAFRAMSGRIGKSYNKANYQVIAPVATMGIRGTDYTVRFCSADCGKGKAQGAAPKNGLYIGVNSGGVWARNAEGEINVNKNQFAFIGAADAKPEFLLQPPALLRARATEDEGEAEEEDKDSSEGKDADAEADTDADDDDGSDEDADGDSSVEDSRENLDPPAAESGEDTGDTGTTPDDSSDTDKPEQTITAQNDEGDELSLEDGEILDDIKDIVDLPEPDDQDGNNGGGDDNKPDDGNPNDGKDNDPDDGNAGGGNDDDKDSNPDDGNNGGG